jgi:type I restriction enzyme S subunit
MSFHRYPAYKDSGVEWLGEVPSEWKVTPLKTIARVINGFPFDSKLFDPNEGFPLVRIRDLNGSSPDARYKGEFVDSASISNDDVLIGMDGDFNVGRWLGEIPALLNQRMCCVRADTSIITRYLQYVLPAPLEAINKLTYATTVKHLSSFDVLKIRLAIPSSESCIAEIVSFLDHETAKIDALIAEQQRLIELLQEKRQAVISHAVTKGLNPHAPMKDSGVEWLGEVPEHWEIMGLTKAIGPVVDYRGRTPTKCDSGTLLVTAKNIRSGEIDYALSEEYVDPLEAEELLQRGRPVIGDVLFTMEAPLGQVALVDREDIALAQRVVKFRGITGRMTNRYLMWWLVGSHCQHQLNSFSTGSTALGLKASKLSAITCVVPPVDEQLAIVDHVHISIGRLSEIHEVAISQIALLQERRSALISAAVTGQIDVRGLVSEAVAA